MQELCFVCGHVLYGHSAGYVEGSFGNSENLRPEGL